MTDFNVIVGDIVDLAPHRMAYTGDIDLERAMVLAVNDKNKTIKVVFFSDNQAEDNSFEVESVVLDVPANRIREVERSYKILRIADSIDTRTEQPVSIITMAKMNKDTINTGVGYIYVEKIDERDTDTFIYTGLSSFDIEEKVGSIKTINFSEFRMTDANLDGFVKAVYISTARVFEPADF